MTIGPQSAMKHIAALEAAAKSQADETLKTEVVAVCQSLSQLLGEDEAARRLGMAKGDFQSVLAGAADMPTIRKAAEALVKNAAAARDESLIYDALPKSIWEPGEQAKAGKRAEDLEKLIGDRPFRDAHGRLIRPSDPRHPRNLPVMLPRVPTQQASATAGPVRERPVPTERDRDVHGRRRRQGDK